MTRLRRVLTPPALVVVLVVVLAGVGVWLLTGDPGSSAAVHPSRSNASPAPDQGSPSGPRTPAWTPTGGTPVSTERTQAQKYAARFTTEWMSWSYTDTKNPMERAQKWATDDWAHSISESLPPPESTPTWRRIQSDQLTLRARVIKVRFVTERQYTATYRVTAAVDEISGKTARKTFDVQMRLVHDRWLVEGFAEVAG